MASLLVDSPPAAPDGLTPSNGQAPPDVGTPTGPPAGSALPAAAGLTCAKCASAMAPGQDWCLRCGAGAPGSLAAPSWRSAAAVLSAVVLLVLGAAVAAYAALSNGTSKPRVVTTTVAQVPAPTTITPTPTATTPGALPGVPGATTPKLNPALPSGIVKPPKIPLTASTPKAAGTNPAFPALPTKPGASKTKAPTSTSTTPSTSTTGGTGRESQPKAILLDTNAATTYNPYNFPAAQFGDPSLAIDGDPSTAWTAEVDPAHAPSMAEGLLIDLKSQQKLSALKLLTATPGMTVQVYGTNALTAPTSITDPAWIPLSHWVVAKKKHLRLKLRDSGKAFNFVTLWISSAPKSAVGTPEAPGHVAVNELELYPA